MDSARVPPKTPESFASFTPKSIKARRLAMLVELAIGALFGRWADVV